MRRGRDQLEAVNLLELAPVRTADWEEIEGRIVVLRPTPWRHGLGGLLDRFFYLMAAKRIKLDEIGSMAWRLLDGNRTVAEVARSLEVEFGDKVVPVDERLGYLVRVLRREELVGYPSWDDWVTRRPSARCVSERTR